MQAFCQHVGTNGYRSDIHSRTCTHLTFAVVPRRSSSCSSLRRFSPCFCAGLLSQAILPLSTSAAALPLQRWPCLMLRMCECYTGCCCCAKMLIRRRENAFHASALANLIHQAFLRKRVFRWERINTAQRGDTPRTRNPGSLYHHRPLRNSANVPEPEAPRLATPASQVCLPAIAISTPVQRHATEPQASGIPTPAQATHAPARLSRYYTRACQSCRLYPLTTRAHAAAHKQGSGFNVTTLLQPLF